MIGGGESDVIFQKVGEFVGKGGGKLGSPVRDDSVIKTELGEDVMEKDVCDVGGRGCFIARAENYPL